MGCYDETRLCDVVMMVRMVVSLGVTCCLSVSLCDALLCCPSVSRKMTMRGAKGRTIDEVNSRGKGNGRISKEKAFLQLAHISSLRRTSLSASSYRPSKSLLSIRSTLLISYHSSPFSDFRGRYALPMSIRRNLRPDLGLGPVSSPFSSPFPPSSPSPSPFPAPSSFSCSGASVHRCIGALRYSVARRLHAQSPAHASAHKAQRYHRNPVRSAWASPVRVTGRHLREATICAVVCNDPNPEGAVG